MIIIVEYCCNSIANCMTAWVEVVYSQIPTIDLHLRLCELLQHDSTIDLSSLSCSVFGDELDNNFTPRRWAELEEAVASRTQDMSELKLIGRGKPLLTDDESSEQTDSEGEIIDSEYESEEDEQQTGS